MSRSHDGMQAPPVVGDLVSWTYPDDVRPWWGEIVRITTNCIYLVRVHRDLLAFVSPFHVTASSAPEEKRS